MIVDTPSSESATIDTRKDDRSEKKKRFDETKRRLQELVDNGELRFDPNGVDDGTNDPLPEIEAIDSASVVTRIRSEYLRRSRNA